MLQIRTGLHVVIENAMDVRNIRGLERLPRSIMGLINPDCSPLPYKAVLMGDTFSVYPMAVLLIAQVGYVQRRNQHTCSQPGRDPLASV
jgi:hypothetical protein